MVVCLFYIVFIFFIFDFLFCTRIVCKDTTFSWYTQELRAIWNIFASVHSSKITEFEDYEPQREAPDRCLSFNIKRTCEITKLFQAYLKRKRLDSTAKGSSRKRGRRALSRRSGERSEAQTLPYAGTAHSMGSNLTRDYPYIYKGHLCSLDFLPLFLMSNMPSKKSERSEETSRERREHLIKRGKAKK